MSGPRNAEDRLKRLLVMLPWLMEVGEVPLVDVAARFEMTEAQVQQDLELVAMCGLPPFVDEMIDVFVDDGTVFVGVPRLFTRPLGLTAPEAFSLVTSARAAMELPGADPGGPLGRGLAKLAAALADVGLDAGSPGADRAARDDTSGVVIDLARPRFADELAAAAATGAELRIRYYTPARDEITERVVVPRHVFADAGNWYVHADDDRSGQRRIFRIDRVERLEPTGRRHPTDETGPSAIPEGFFVDAEVPRAVLRLGPDAAWVVDQYPVDAVTPVEDRPGWSEVTLPVSSERWLAKLVIRLGPQAELMAPADARQTIEHLVDAMLDNYRAGDT